MSLGRTSTILGLAMLLAAGYAAHAQAGYDEAVEAYSAGEFTRAFEEALPASEAGDARAQTLVANLYEYGIGVTRDVDMAIRWYEAAAKQGHAGAMVSLSLMLIDGRAGGKRDPERARDLLREAAEAGFAPAQHNLALLFAGAGGLEPDWEKSAEWFRKAAEQDLADAQYNLGVLYAEGRGVEKNMIEAGRWISKAASQGLPDAALDYGIMVFRGEGVQKNEEIGAQWLLVAARQGNVVAQNRVAHLYILGRGVETDPVEGAKWHLLAAEGGRTDDELDAFLASLTEDQIAEAQQRVRAFKARQLARRTPSPASGSGG